MISGTKAADFPAGQGKIASGKISGFQRRIKAVLTEPMLCPRVSMYESVIPTIRST
jgi:hypothetical protein